MTTIPAHEISPASPNELGIRCTCGKRFPTRKAAEEHVEELKGQADHAEAQTAGSAPTVLVESAPEPAPAADESYEAERPPEAPSGAHMSAVQQPNTGLTPAN